MYVHELGENFYCIDPHPKDVVVGFICSYVLASDGEAVVIETGPDTGVKNLVSELDRLGLREGVRYIIVTHIHLDHGGGLGRMLKMLPRAVGIAHPRAIKHLINPEKLWRASRAALGWLGDVYGPPLPAPEDRLMEAGDGEVIRVGGLELRLIHTVGHASHHISVYVPDRGLLFTGDSAGIYLKDIDRVVPTTMQPFKLDPYLDSLDKQASLNPEILAYTHTWIARDGARRLREHKKQVLRLLDLAVEGIRKGVKREGMVEWLSGRDPEVKGIVDYIDGDKVLRDLLELAVNGLYDEALKRV